MIWLNVTRSTGDLAGPGEFTVEDRNGIEWQVEVVRSKRDPSTLACLNNIGCLNGCYEAGLELTVDLQQAVYDKISEELEIEKR